MAKITSKTTDVQEEQKIESAVNQQDVEYLVKELQSLRQDYEALKSEAIHPMKKARERYEGERDYSYKLWGGVPVLSYVSEKKDPTKDLLYKAASGVYVSNHILKLDLANGKTVKVEVNEFNDGFTRSEKMKPKAIITQGGKKSYLFENDEFGEFAVLDSVIN